MPEPFLSIVIPAFNEASRIGSTLASIRSHMDSQRFDYEVIVVDDGSSDSTPQILREIVNCYAKMRILRNERNRGKGFSVRRGVLEAYGDFILFTDADLSAPIEEAGKLLNKIRSTRADAVIGSRALDRELIRVHQPPLREYGGRIFNLLVRILTGLPFRDTQCGLKLFRRATTRLAFEMMQIPGFGFDPELLFLIRRFGGCVVEVPVRWSHDRASKVHFVRDATRMMGDLVEIRWRALTGAYPNSAHVHSAPHQRAAGRIYDKVKERPLP